MKIKTNKTKIRIYTLQQSVTERVPSQSKIRTLRKSTLQVSEIEIINTCGCNH